MNVWLDLDSLARGLGRNKVDVKNQWLAHSGGVVFDMWWMTNLFHLAYLVTRLGVAPLLRESLSHPVMN